MGQHWEPRSRGVATVGERGFFFSGREVAYERVRGHLVEGSGLLVVTGSRGSGKSASLARALVLGCRRYLTLLGDLGEEAVAGYALPGRAVDAAVLARGKPVAAVAGEIGEQLGLGRIAADELVSTLLRDEISPAVVVDAVDESADPGSLLRELLVPLAHSGARVAVAGLRRRVRLQPSEAGRVVVDQPPFRDEQALVEYVRRRLAGGGVYPDEDEARLVAAAVGQAADGLFLVAEVVARTLARSPVDTSVPGWEARLPRDATEAFAEYLERFDDQRRRVLALLHPLALARGDGLDLDPGTLWLTAANALRWRDLALFERDDLYRARQQADDYLLATGEGDDGAAVP